MRHCLLENIPLSHLSCFCFHVPFPLYCLNFSYSFITSENNVLYYAEQRFCLSYSHPQAFKDLEAVSYQKMSGRFYCLQK